MNCVGTFCKDNSLEADNFEDFTDSASSTASQVIFFRSFGIATSVFFSLHFTFIRLKKNTLTILHNPQIAKLIEAGYAFKSNVIISKNEQKKVNNYNEIIITYY